MSFAHIVKNSNVFRCFKYNSSNENTQKHINWLTRNKLG